MIGRIIQFVMENIPALMFVLALAIPLLFRRPGTLAPQFLSWLLLLSVGVAYVWAGVFHIFFPGIASAQIGWQPSPFEFEIGVADAAIGIVAILSFWRGLEFKAAVVGYIVLFSIGVAIGHFRQAFQNNDFSADNFGLLLIITLLQIALLPILLQRSRQAA
ncbi:MAG: hypothetical protein DI533_00160 [Cereibacter sphaeroides]|uniref:DUF4345 domain-containing protein n=1 Tax=Cereibacter sphaeroides TaxID=1063 RepID=A0A2W5UMR4_CERSP|nr:MAG: hypothetical protein DI533_00160 [Cereibacter sphaeroides]